MVMYSFLVLGGLVSISHANGLRRTELFSKAKEAGLSETARPRFPAYRFQSILKAALQTPEAACGHESTWGVDFRNCFNTLHDLTGQPVCGKEPLDVLVKAYYGEIEFDAAGNSGSTLIKSLPKYIIKSVSDDELAAMKEAIPKMSFDMFERDKRTFLTAITPTCLTVVDASKQSWAVLRKVEIEGGERFKIKANKTMITPEWSADWFDLKGPKFNNQRDLKTALNFVTVGGVPLFGKRGVWKHKDIGFSIAFPAGLQLSTGKRVRDAALSILRDSHTLMDTRMTDYSLYIAFYKNPVETVRRSQGAVWPLILDVSPKAKLGTGVVMAVGIIDYIERNFRSEVPAKAFSTMRDPAQFRCYWMTMWPKYFVPPESAIKVSIDRKRTKMRRDDFEAFEQGDVVVAIQELKWTADKWPMLASRAGSKYKVYPGARGMIQGFNAAGVLRVSWTDGLHEFGTPVLKPHEDWNVGTFNVKVHAVVKERMR